MFRRALVHQLCAIPLLYEPWRRYREWRDLTAFRKLLDVYLGSSINQADVLVTAQPKRAWQTIRWREGKQRALARTRSLNISMG